MRSIPWRASRAVPFLATVVLVAGLLGCSGGPDGVPSADCGSGVLFRGDEYVHVRGTDVVGEPLEDGVVARCDDLGPDAAGLVFDPDGPPTAVWRVPGIAPEEAVATRWGERYAVMLNERLSDRERDDVLAALGLE